MSQTSPGRGLLPRVSASFLLFLLVLTAGAALRIWYASGELHVSRFEDEKYSLRNVRKVLETWDFEPASAYYPSPVFNLPQALVLEASEELSQAADLPALSIYEMRGPTRVFGPTAFLITRLYQTLCGVLTLWLAFLIGRRLATPTAGLLAATILAFMPWMIHSSGYNKPDALLVMAVLLSLHAALRAVDATRPWPEDRPRRRRTVSLWMWAGVCIAVAMSAKITGGFAAVPLTVGALLASGDRGLRLRRFGLLALAGATSAISFILMNPYWRAYLFFLRGLQRDYAGRTEASRWEIPGKVAAMHLESFFLGPLLGSLALLAFLACVGLLLWRWRSGAASEPSPDPSSGQSTGPSAHPGMPTQIQLAMLVAYPLVYAVAYAAQTAYFKPNNFLPTIPFTVLAFAVCLDGALRAAEARRPARGQAMRVVLGAALALLVVPVGWRYAYHSRVPTTLDVVVAQLNQRLQPTAGHVVLMERWTPPPIPWDGTRALHKGLSTVSQVDELSELPREVVELAAALVLVDPDGSDDKDAAGRWPTSRRWTVEPELLRYRGPRMEVVLRDGDRSKFGLEPVACGPACVEAALPIDADELDGSVKPGEVVSVFVLLPGGEESDPHVTIGDAETGKQVRLYLTSRKRDGALFASPRVTLPEGAARLRIEGSASDQGAAFDVGRVQIELHQWSPSRNQQ